MVWCLALLAGCGTQGSHSTSSAGPPAITADRAVPASIADLPLTDQHGATTSLRPDFELRHDNPPVESARRTARPTEPVPSSGGLGSVTSKVVGTAR